MCSSAQSLMHHSHTPSYIIELFNYLKFMRDFSYVLSHNEILTNRRSDLRDVLEIEHRCEDCISAVRGCTSAAIWCVGRFYSEDGTPWARRRQEPKLVGVSVRQCNLVFEKWCTKCCSTCLYRPTWRVFAFHFLNSIFVLMFFLCFKT